MIPKGGVELELVGRRPRSVLRLAHKVRAWLVMVPAAEKDEGEEVRFWNEGLVVWTDQTIRIGQQSGFGIVLEIAAHLE